MSSLDASLLVHSPDGEVPRRTRYNSWSRPRRTRDSNNKDVNGAHRRSSKHHYDHVVEEKTHICFAEDGEWFQGSIIPPQHGIFKIHGRRNDHVGGLLDGSNGGLLPNGNVLRSANVSESSSLCSLEEEDPTDARMMLEPFDTSDESVTSSTTLEDDPDDLDHPFELYTVKVADLDTGLSYHLNDVRVTRRGADSCCMRSEALSFASDRVLKGTLADRMLHEVMGPSFTDRQLTVFTGRVVFRFRDMPCKPVSVLQSQIYM